jgi:hypothetical protein
MRMKCKILFTYHVKPCFSVEVSASGKMSWFTFIEVSEIYEDKWKFMTYISLIWVVFRKITVQVQNLHHTTHYLGQHNYFQNNFTE